MTLIPCLNADRLPSIFDKVFLPFSLSSILKISASSKWTSPSTSPHPLLGAKACASSPSGPSNIGWSLSLEWLPLRNSIRISDSEDLSNSRNSRAVTLLQISKARLMAYLTSYCLSLPRDGKFTILERYD